MDKAIDLINNNAYDLRYTDYRYMRGRSPYIDEVESLFSDACLVPTGMAAISLVLQYYKPKTIWFPKELYRETQNLLRLLKIEYTEDNPDMVLYDYPSFRNIKYVNPYPGALLVVDNSLDPAEEPACDILLTSLSKHYVNCETVLGLITFKTHKEDLANMKLLRCASGYAVFDFQCEALLRNFKDYKNLLLETKKSAKEVARLLSDKGYRTINIGSIVFVLVDGNPRDIALRTPFELRPTYGSKRTFCSYSYYDGDLIYFGSKYIRLSIGLDYSSKKIADVVDEAIKKGEK